MHTTLIVNLIRSGLVIAVVKEETNDSVIREKKEKEETKWTRDMKREKNMWKTIRRRIQSKRIA